MLIRIIMLAMLCIGTSQRLFAESEHHEEEAHQEKEIVRMSADVVKRYHITLDKAGPKAIEVRREVLGKIVPNANKTIYIYPRYGGIIKKMTKRQKGDKKGGTTLTYAYHTSLAPKASEASWGLSIFSRGSKWLLLCERKRLL